MNLKTAFTIGCWVCLALGCISLFVHTLGGATAFGVLAIAFAKAPTSL